MPSYAFGLTPATPADKSALMFMQPPPALLVSVVKKIRNALEACIRRSFPAPVSLIEIIVGQWIGEGVLVAADLGIADLLKDGPKSVESLARLADVDADALYRLLRMLAAKGIFREIRSREFALNRLSRPLIGDREDSVRGFCRMVNAPFHRAAWADLRYSVKTGKSAFEKHHGQTLFEYLAANPAASEIFDGAMTGWASQSCAAVVGAVNFARFKKFVDIGGGRGIFLAALLKRAPDSRGVLFDRDQVIEKAALITTDKDLAGRCEILAGDFFKTVPSGGDAYFLKNIIHDWDDQAARLILSRIRTVLPTGGRLFIIESVVAEGNVFHPGKLIDLEMLVCTSGGRERTEAEFRRLLDGVGLRLIKNHPTAAIESVLEIAVV